MSVCLSVTIEQVGRQTKVNLALEESRKGRRILRLSKERVSRPPHDPPPLIKMAPLPLALAQMFLVLLFSLLLRGNLAVELTFELPDNAKECFHEVIEKGTESTLEFQVPGNTHSSKYIWLALE